MNLKDRIAKIELRTLKSDKVHFIGWAECEWRRAEGLEREQSESVVNFLKRVQSVSANKIIWCD